MESQSNYLASYYNSIPESTFSPSIPRADGFLELIICFDELRHNIEPRFNEIKLAKVPVEKIIAARKLWATAVEAYGKRYQEAYGDFTTKEKKIYRDELSHALSS